MLQYVNWRRFFQKMLLDRRNGPPVGKMGHIIPQGHSAVGSISKNPHGGSMLDFILSDPDRQVSAGSHAVASEYCVQADPYADKSDCMLMPFRMVASTPDHIGPCGAFGPTIRPESFDITRQARWRRACRVP